ncbi:MAG: GDSL-type esterase/lipase family protein, partial [Cyanobacteriota bacterium]|nr:GDSL-type esterase/lipase family protein [Cyanobacteriota bacterium]
SKTFASDGGLIRLTNGSTSGTASLNFTGTSGSYDVVIGYYDEQDGKSQVSVSVGGNTLDTWTFDQKLGSTRAHPDNFLTRTLSTGMNMNSGDLIEIEGLLDRGEVARFDYIEFIPAGDPIPDTTAPTASLSAIDFSSTPGDTNSYSFDVTYSDDVALDLATLDSSDVRVTGNGFDELATFVSADTNNGETTVTYEIDAPVGGWQLTDDGTYTISLETDEVGDTSGNFVASGILGDFQVNVEADTTVPTASLSAVNFSPVVGNTNSYSFDVTYSDDVALDLSSIDSSDVRVNGGNGFDELATFISANTSNGETTVTYEIDAPVGGWQLEDDGTYAISLETDEVSDTSGNFVASGMLGNFELDVTSAPPPSNNPIRIEAEDMMLSGYRLESKTFASDGGLIRLINGSTSGTASLNFTGASGSYDVVVGYYDERDGNSEVSVSVGGNTLDTWTFDRNLVSTRAHPDNFLTRTLSTGMNVNSGDLIEIEGLLDRGEVARFDYIEFIPAGDPIPDTTAPTASLSATNFNPAVGNSNSYSFDVTYTDDVALDLTTLDSNDVRVSGGNGFDELATFVSADTSNGETTVIYEIDAPADGWQLNDDGTYTIAIETDEVSDTSGNSVVTGALGNFQVNVKDIPSGTHSYDLAAKGVLVNLEQGTGFISNYDNDTPIRIMPLGDSITQGKVNNLIPEAEREGYRGFLWEHFEELGLAIDFVGSESNGTSNLPDKDHQGHSGWKMNQIRANVRNWIPASEPDVILLKIGTNDAGGEGSNMASQLNKVIDRILAQKAFDGELLVSSIPPINANSFYYESRMPSILDYNALIPGVVASKPDSANVSFVDTWSGPNGLTEDDMSGPPNDNGLHPAVTGYEKIAQFWYDAVLEQTGERADLSNVDDVIGSGFDDVITGNANSNTIEGGAGNDTITGGSGADRFVYSAPTDGGDVLTDFDSSENDRFEISAAGFGSGLSAGVSLSLTDAVTGVFASGVAPMAIGTSAHFLYDTASGVLSFDADGTGLSDAMEIATLSGAPTLSASDFSIV